MQRTDLLDSLKNEAMKVVTEDQQEQYKSLTPFYPQLVTMRSISEIPGAFLKETSIIGISELYEREEGEAIRFVDPTQGFPISVKKRSFDVGEEITLEANRDFKALKTELVNWVKKQQFPTAVTETKELAVHGLFNTGAYLLGSKYFNNNIPGIENPSYGQLCYDSKPLFNASNNTRTAKNGSTYYNSLGALSLSYDNLVTADTLLLSTNAKREDGRPYNNNQNNFLLVNPALKTTAERILNSTNLPGSQDNDVNPLKSAYKPIFDPYFTDTDAWVIGNKKGIWLFDSNDVKIDMWEVHETRKIRVSAHIELAYAVFNWRAFVAANLATA